MIYSDRIKLANKEECTGCNACVSACSMSSIQMKYDKEGFLQPYINTKTCIKCHKCEKVCPVLNKRTIEFQCNKTTAYAANNKNDDIRKISSSGGIFYEISKFIINNNGIVFGATFDDDFNVVHKYVTKIHEIDSLCGSKYVQSKIGNSFLEVKRFLKEGRLVLFSGTPCQVAGLCAFLGKSYENLILVDLVCHGVPSPLVWRKFLFESFISDLNLENNKIDFRNKNFGWGYNFTINEKLVYNGYKSNPFYFGFISNVLLRRSCYKCNFRDYNRVSDITLGDYWETERFCKVLSDGKGTSLLLVHSNKGKSLINTIKDEINLIEQDKNDVIISNPQIIYQTKINSKRRYFFFLNSFLPFSIAKHAIYHDFIFIRVIRKIKRIIKK